MGEISDGWEETHRRRSISGRAPQHLHTAPGWGQTHCYKWSALSGLCCGFPKRTAHRGATASNAGLVFDLATNSARQISHGISSLPVAWSMDNKDLYSVNFRDSVYRIVKTNMQTGKVQLWKTLPLGDQAGVLGLSALAIAPATGAYAYSTGLNLSRLYLVDGWL